MPAEWEHQGTFLGWPHELTDWPGKVAPIRLGVCGNRRHLARVGARVSCWSKSREAESRVKTILKKSHAKPGQRAISAYCQPTGVDARLRTDLCEEGSGAARFNHFVFQRLGEIANTTKGRTGSQPCNQSLRRKLFCRKHGRRVVLGGRLDRRQWLGHASHHGRSACKARFRSAIQVSLDETTKKSFATTLGVTNVCGSKTESRATTRTATWMT
jgi:hypothetical protein